MPWPPAADRDTQEYYARQHRRRERLARKRGRKSGAGWLVSLALHFAMLGSLARVAGLEPAPTTLEVFAADLTPEKPAPAPAPRARAIVRRAEPRKGRVARPKPSVVARRTVTTPSRTSGAQGPASAPTAPGGSGGMQQAFGAAASEALAVASAPQVAAPAMTLTPAQTLTPIEPTPATLPAAGAVVVQANSEAPSTTVPEPLPVQTAQPTAPEPLPVQTAAPVQTGPESAPEVMPVQTAPRTVPEPMPAVPSLPTPPAPAPAKPSLPTPAPAPPTAPAPAPAPPSSPSPRTAVAHAATSALPLDAPSPPDAPPATQAHEVAPAAPARAGSGLGLGLGRLRIRLDGDRTRTTVHGAETISGTLVGGEAGRLKVQVGDVVTEPTLEGRTFSTSVALKPGRNHVRVVAASAPGGEVEETVTIDYHAPIGLTITNPRDGHTLTPQDPPLVVVQGVVEDSSVSSVWVAVGERRVTVPVVSGRFRHTVPVVEPTVQVRVETPAMEGRAPASATVTVHAPAAASTVALLLHWPRDAAAPAAVAATWRSRSDRTEGVQRVTLETAEGEASPDFFYLRNPRPGVYTFVLTYQPGAPEAVQPALYVPTAGRRLKTLRPATLNGSGRVVLARVLMPHGVLWEDDDWFTGRSASGDTVTKFRFPDGITWTERTGSDAR